VIPHDAGFPEPAGNTPQSRRAANPVAGRIDAPRRIPMSDSHTAAAPAALSSTPDMGTFLRGLRRRWIAAVALGGSLAVLAGLAAWFLMSPKYIAFARIQVAYDPPTVGAGSSGGRGDFLTYLKTQAAQIKSRPVIWGALKSDDVKRLNLDSLGKDPAQFIENELMVDFQENQEMVTITLGAADPQMALALVKAVLESYMENIVYAEARRRDAKVSTLDKAYNTAAASLKQKQEDLSKMTKDQGNTDPVLLAFHLSELQANIHSSTTERRTLRVETARAEADLADHETRMKMIKDASLTPAFIESALKTDAEAQSYQKIIEHCQEIIDDFEKKTPGQNWPSLTACKIRKKKTLAKFETRKKELGEELVRRAGALGSGGRLYFE
jgi:capsular polysaccharide biosynthesis protein